MNLLIYLVIFLYAFSAIYYGLFFFLQKDYMYKSGFSLLIGAIVFNTALLIYYFIKIGPNVFKVYEVLLILSWSMSFVYVLLQIRFPIKVLGLFSSFFSLLLIVLAFNIPQLNAKSFFLTNSLWFIVHIFSVFLAVAAFTLSFILGFMYLLQEHSIKTKEFGFLFKRIPSLELLDVTGYISIVIGFVLLTIGIFAGFVFANSICKLKFCWDPKEIWSCVTWLLYAALLHQRLAAKWRGKKTALMAIVGFGLIVIIFIGVNFFIPATPYNSIK